MIKNTGLPYLLFMHAKSSSAARREFLTRYAGLYGVRKLRKKRGPVIEQMIKRELAACVEDKPKYWNEDPFFPPTFSDFGRRHIAFRRKPKKKLNTWQIRRNILDT